MAKTHQTKRYRGRQRIMLRRLIKTVKEIERNNAKYPGGPTGDRNYLLSPEVMADLTQARGLAAQQLDQLWPILIPLGTAGRMPAPPAE